MKRFITVLFFTLALAGNSWATILCSNVNGGVPYSAATLEVARTSPSCKNGAEVTSVLTAAQSNITAPWPADRALEVKKGGSIGNTTALTINGPFSAGLYQVFSGAGSVVFGSGAVSEVYPEWFGAKGDGVNDDRQSFQWALSSGAKTITLTDNSVYLLNSYTGGDGGDVLQLGPTGCTIKANNSATIKLGVYTHNKSLNMISGLSYGAPTRSNLIFENITFDGNAANSFMVSSEKLRVILQVRAVNNTQIRNCTFKDFDSTNVIAVTGGRGLIIDNCRFVDVVQNHAFDVDHSTIYSVTAETFVTNNYFSNASVTGSKSACAIEYHASNGTFVNNIVNSGYTRCAYVAALASENTLVGNIIFESNQVYITNAMVYFVTSDGCTVMNIFIGNNNIQSSHVVGESTLYNGYQGIVNQASYGIGSYLNNIQITNNSFQSLYVLPGVEEHRAFGLTLREVSGLYVNGNSFRNSTGIRLGADPYDIRDVNISNNKFYSDNTSSPAYGFLNFTAKSINSVTVKNNSIGIATPSYDTPIRFYGADSCSNIEVSDNSYTGVLPSKSELYGGTTFQTGTNIKYRAMLYSVPIVIPSITTGVVGVSAPDSTSWGADHGDIAYKQYLFNLVKFPSPNGISISASTIGQGQRPNWMTYAISGYAGGTVNATIEVVRQ